MRHLLLASALSAVATFLLTRPSLAASPWPDLTKPAEAVGGSEKDVVVIVAIEHYQYLPGKPGALAAAKSWQAYFATTRRVPADRVKLLVDDQARSQNIASTIARALQSVMPGGRFWFLFIGHAFPEVKDDDFRLLGWETGASLESIYALGLLQMELLRSSRERSVYIIDASIGGQSTNIKAPRQRIPENERGLIRLDTLSDKLRGAIKGGDKDLLVADLWGSTCQLPGVELPAFSYLLLGALRGWANRSDAPVPRKREDAIRQHQRWIAEYVSDALSAFVPCDQEPWPGGGLAFPEWEGKRRLTEKGPDLGAMALGDFEASLEVPISSPQPPPQLGKDGLGVPLPMIRATMDAEFIASLEEHNMYQRLRGTLGAVVTGPYLPADAWEDAAEAAPPGRYREAALARARLWTAYGKEVDEVQRLRKAEYSRLKLILRSPSIAQGKKESLIAAYAKRRSVDAAAAVVAEAVTGEELIHFCSPYLTTAKNQEVFVSAVDHEGADVPVAVFVDGVEIGTGPRTFKLASCASKIRIVDGATHESASRDLSPGSYQAGIHAKLRRFTVDGDFVIDHEARMTWQRSVSTPLSKSAATRYCPGLNVGAEGWRMPNLYDLERLHALDPTTTPYAALELERPRALWAVVPEGHSLKGDAEQVEVPAARPFRFARQAAAPVRCVREGTKLPKTCDKETLGRLGAAQREICKALRGRSCDGAKVPSKLLSQYRCSEIHKRIEKGQECLEQEKAIRAECFAGTPDEKKRASLQQLENEVRACLDLAAVNCSAGHPMAEQ
jgi:hypothetical protein